MSTDLPTTAESLIPKWQLWTGRVLSTLIVLMLLLDGVMKLFKPAPVLEACAKLGIPESTVVPIGLVLIISTILYAIPLTSILGAILLTGYLGGAVFCHVRVGDPLFSHALIPVYLGILVWGGLYGRGARLRALIPFRK
jgi:hypothetical protein